MKYASSSLALVALGLGAAAALASDVVVPEEEKANDNLNAVLWDQSAVEAQAASPQTVACARAKSAAAADGWPSWTHAPVRGSRVA